MNSPKKNKLGHQPQKISYTSRYKASHDPDLQWSRRTHMTNNKIWNQSEIIQRREKIMDKIQKETEQSRMLIEDDSIEANFYRDDYLDLQLMWLKKIHQIQEETHKIKHINTQDVKIIKGIEEDIGKRKIKMTELETKLQEVLRFNQTAMASIEQQEDQYEKNYRELVRVVQQGQKQIAQLKRDREQLMTQNAQLVQSIQKLRNTISESTEPIQPQQQNASQSSLQAMTPRIQSMLSQIQALQVQNARLQHQINQKEDQVEADQQDLSLNFQIAQKVFIIKELDKLEQLMMVKQNEIKREVDYERNKQFLKSKQKEIQALEKEVKKKQAVVQDLTEQIKKKSDEYLNVFLY